MRGQSHGPNPPEHPSERPEHRQEFRPLLPIAVLVLLFLAWAGVALVLWLLLAEG
jgi:hypothetical protein